MSVRELNKMVEALRKARASGLEFDNFNLDDAARELNAVEQMCFYLAGETKKTAEESRSVALLESIAQEVS